MAVLGGAPENKEETMNQLNEVMNISDFLGNQSKIADLFEAGPPDILTSKILEYKDECEKLLVVINGYLFEGGRYSTYCEELQRLMKFEQQTPGMDSSSAPPGSGIPESQVGGYPGMHGEVHESNLGPKMSESEVKAGQGPLDDGNISGYPGAMGASNPPDSGSGRDQSSYPGINQAQKPEPPIESDRSASHFHSPRQGDSTFGKGSAVSGSQAPGGGASSPGSSFEQINTLQIMLTSKENFLGFEGSLLKELKSLSSNQQFLGEMLALLNSCLNLDSFSPSQKLLSLEFLWRAIDLKIPALINVLLKSSLWKTIKIICSFKKTKKASESTLFNSVPEDAFTNRTCYEYVLLICLDLSLSFGMSKSKVETPFRKHFNDLIKDETYLDYLLNLRFPSESLGDACFLFKEVSNEHRATQDTLNKCQHLRYAFLICLTQSSETHEDRARQKTAEVQIFIEELIVLNQTLAENAQTFDNLARSVPSIPNILKDHQEFAQEVIGLRRKLEEEKILSKSEEYLERFQILVVSKELPSLESQMKDPKISLEEEASEFLEGVLPLKEFLGRIQRHLSTNLDLIGHLIQILGSAYAQNSQGRATSQVQKTSRVIQAIRGIVLPEMKFDSEDKLDYYQQIFGFSDLCIGLKQSVIALDEETRRPKGKIQANRSHPPIYREAKSLFEELARAKFKNQEVRNIFNNHFQEITQAESNHHFGQSSKEETTPIIDSLPQFPPFLFLFTFLLRYVSA